MIDRPSLLTRDGPAEVAGGRPGGPQRVPGLGGASAESGQGLVRLPPVATDLGLDAPHRPTHPAQLAQTERTRGEGQANHEGDAEPERSGGREPGDGPAGGQRDEQSDGPEQHESHSSELARRLAVRWTGTGHASTLE